MKAAGVAVKTSYSSSLGTFLAERYLPIDIDELLFVNALEPDEATMAVKADLYNLSYWLVLYAPVSLTTKSNRVDADSFTWDFDVIINRLNSN